MMDKIDSDDSLYNAMIWALSIGIVIVIVTLFLTRPPPESFTELYFNNHTLLPEYVQPNIKYNYSFSIHNLENQNMTYNYTISTEYYNLSYQCLNPTLYLENINDTYQTSDVAPELLVREKNYSISFSYTLRNGNQLAFIMMRPDKTLLYEIVIDSSTATIVSTSAISYPIQLFPGSNTFNLKVNPNNMTLKIGNSTIYFNTPKSYTAGYPEIQTSLADISSMTLSRYNTKETISIRYADAKSQSITLNTPQGPNIVLQYVGYLATNVPANVQNIQSNIPSVTQSIYNKLYYQPTIPATKIVRPTIYTSGPTNMSDYTLRVIFRTDTLSMGLDDLKLYYENPDLTVSYNNIDTTITLANINSFNTLELRITPNNAFVYWNNNNITSIKITSDLSKNNISLEKFDDNAIIREFSARSNTDPVSISYTIPERAPQVTYSSIIPSSYINVIPYNTTANKPNPSQSSESQYVQSLFESQYINWTNYRFFTNFLFKQNISMSVLMQSLSNINYAINISNNNLTLTYKKANVQKQFTANITMDIINSLVIEANNGTLTLTFDNAQVFHDKIDNASDGAFTFNYPGVNVFSSQVQNMETAEVRIYQEEQLTCDPVLTAYQETNSTTLISNTALKTFNTHASFNETFDIAKVTVTLLNKSQEIHFWVKDLGMK